MDFRKEREIGLKRFQQSGQTHFITLACYHRRSKWNPKAILKGVGESVSDVPTSGDKTARYGAPRRWKLECGRPSLCRHARSCSSAHEWAAAGHACRRDQISQAGRLTTCTFPHLAMKLPDMGHPGFITTTAHIWR